MTLVPKRLHTTTQQTREIESEKWKKYDTTSPECENSVKNCENRTSEKRDEVETDTHTQTPTDQNNVVSAI